jgi:flagellum-specific peptidoglycan hydrolase FlgJ
MKKYVKYILILSFLIPLNGCNKKETKVEETNVTNSNNELKLKRKDGDREDKILEKIGISTKDDKIIIEPKKTKEFLEKMANKLKKEAKKIEQKTKEINISQMGIKASDKKIEIDINKTEKFLNKFSKELEDIAKELQKVFDDK